MSTILTENVQNVDNELSQVCADSLRISVILRNIFKHFDNDELLTLSSVNKLWNYEARSVMRERGNLTAYLKSDDSKCQHLEAFASDLQQMNVIPFGGVNIKSGGGLLDRHEECQPPSTAPLNRTVILDGLSWKHFSLELNGLRLNESCQSFLLAKEILQDYGGSLEQLSISIYLKRNEVIEQVLQECNFQRLKILKIDSCENFVKLLVSHAPNLQEFHSQAPLSSLATVLEGSSARLMYSLWTSFDQVPESIVNALRLENIRLHYTGEAFSIDRFNRIAPQLLQTSSTTLTSMEIDAVLAVPLMSYGICLRNVTELSMTVDIQQLQLVQPRILTLAKGFDFTRIFPNLNEVSVRCEKARYEYSPDDIETFVDQANLMLKEPLPDRAAKIKHLSAALGDFSVQFFAEMFPDTEKLSVMAHHRDFYETPELPFGLIWTHWEGLMELEVIYYHGRNSPRILGGLDSDFCGIFPEEIAELREKDEEYLKAVNIVPVMPSITRLKNLKTFNVCYHENNGHDDAIQFVFSKVTKFLAFGRCPQLVSCTFETID